MSNPPRRVEAGRRFEAKGSLIPCGRQGSLDPLVAVRPAQRCSKLILQAHDGGVMCWPALVQPKSAEH